MAWLKAAAPWLQVAGTAMSVNAELDAGSQDAAQLRAMATSTRATAQRAGIEEQRKARILDSRARAVAAASGAGATDLDVLNARAGIQGEGDYRALTQVYEGETQARGMEYAAKSRKKAAADRGIATVLDSASSFASKYGQ